MENKCFYELLGWQGGTIHDVAKELGVDSTDLLYGKPKNSIGIDSDYMKGQFAFGTCSKEFVKNTLLPKYKGNLDFWLGYKRGEIIGKDYYLNKIESAF